MNAILTIKPASDTIALPAVVGGEFASLPAPVKRAIIKIDLACPAGVNNLSQGEVALRNEVYAEAIEGFPQIVVTGALKHLLLNNKRNPFAPTPQDVHEQCEKMLNDVSNALISYAGGSSWLPPRWLSGCPAPWSPGCLLSPEFICETLKRFSWWKVHLAPPDGRLPSDEAFERIPHDVFEGREREHIAAERNEIKEENANTALEDEVNRLRRLEKYGEPTDPMTNEPHKKKVTA